MAEDVLDPAIVLPQYLKTDGFGLAGPVLDVLAKVAHLTGD